MADKEMTHEIDRLKKDVARLTRLTQRRVADRWEDLDMDEMTDRAKEYWSEASDKVKDQYNVAKDKARETAKKTDEYAHDNPWHVAGVAAAVGLVAGLILIGSKRDR